MFRLQIALMLIMSQACGLAPLENNSTCSEFASAYSLDSAVNTQVFLSTQKDYASQDHFNDRRPMGIVVMGMTFYPSFFASLF